MNYSDLKLIFSKSDYSTFIETENNVVASGGRVVIYNKTKYEVVDAVTGQTLSTGNFNVPGIGVIDVRKLVTLKDGTLFGSFMTAGLGGEDGLVRLKVSNNNIQYNWHGSYSAGALSSGGAVGGITFTENTIYVSSTAPSSEFATNVFTYNNEGVIRSRYDERPRRTNIVGFIGDSYIQISPNRSSVSLQNRSTVESITMAGISAENVTVLSDTEVLVIGNSGNYEIFSVAGVTNAPGSYRFSGRVKAGRIPGYQSGYISYLKWTPSGFVAQTGRTSTFYTYNEITKEFTLIYTAVSGLYYVAENAQSVVFSEFNSVTNAGFKGLAFYGTNSTPTITLSTTNERTLYENDTYGISGNAKDSDSGDVVSVKYQLNNGLVRAIATSISTGADIPFNKILTFKAGALYDGATAVTPTLAEGSQHVLKVWSEDDKGGKSADQTRTFYVVPNRPAQLTVDPFSQRTDLIDSDKVTVSGNVSDPDSNTVTVKYKIANGSYMEVYSGSGGAWSFLVNLASLAVGENTLTIQATDEYGAVTSKTLQVTKAENTHPLKHAVTRYKLTPPNGTAKGVLLWIEREVGDLVVDAEISMGMNGEAENFVPMTKSATAFVREGIEEDEFTFDAGTAKESIILKITMERTSTASNKGITLISGVLS